jgi:hypothetical protein
MTDTRFLQRFCSDTVAPVCPTITEIDAELTNIPWMAIPNTIVVPDDRDLFFSKWEKSKTIMGATALWDSLCIWKNPDIADDKVMHAEFPYIVEDWSAEFPMMIAQIRTLMPFSTLNNIVLCSNIKTIPPHMDVCQTYYPWPNSLRVMIWDTNDKPTFYCLPWPDSSYAQPPLKSLEPALNQNIILGHIPNKDKIYVDLPPDSNTFVFSNGEFLHGADLAKPKIIMLIHGTPDVDVWKTKLSAIRKNHD